MKRVAAWILIAAGAVLTVGGAAFVFSESRVSLVAGGGGAIVVGLVLLAWGIVLRARTRKRRPGDWRFAPRS